MMNQGQRMVSRTNSKYKLHDRKSLLCSRKRKVSATKIKEGYLGGSIS